MNTLGTTRLSSKGQVVIPEAVRKALGLEPGTCFIVLSDGDVVMLKPISPPARSAVRSLAAEVRRKARRAGVRPADVASAIRGVRRRR